MLQELNFGPYLRWEAVSAFHQISERAFALFDGHTTENWNRLAQPTHHLFLRIAYQAKTTSLAARLVNSWVFNLPAIALTRIRLEQVIVSSYLIHEQEEKALAPFVQYLPIKRFNQLRHAMSVTTIAQELGLKFDMEAFRAEARSAYEQMTGSSPTDDDQYQRNWTKLDLKSMAHHRDQLANQTPNAITVWLERDYDSIYRVMSSVVHADGLSVSTSFLDVFACSSDSTPVLMPVPSWASIVAAAVANYDVLQCHEILTWLGLPMNSECQLLHEEWLRTRDRHLSDVK